MASSDQRTPAADVAHDLIAFLNTSWTPFHAVEESTSRLLAAGFERIREKDAWDLQLGKKYFFTKNTSTIVAFAVGAKYQPGNGFYMVGAHTDSPCLKLKPVSQSIKGGCLMVNVEPYGGGLWSTWFDRDLTVAGRVIVRVNGSLQQRLVRITKPILRIPMLAIHLQRDYYTQGFKPNTQTHLAPLLATSIKAELKESKGGKSHHHTVLLELIASELGAEVDDIVDFELNVCDVQPATIGGIKDEFIYSGRLDNLAMSFCALQALIESSSALGALDDEEHVRAIALFDHEEVGSASAQGAGGPVMRDTITRVACALSNGQEGACERSLRESFLVSADMAHALHPNYEDKYDPQNHPKFHGGLVLKYNQNQRYATNLISAVLFREVARRHGLPCQEFAVRNDMPCGSTIGPILASNLGCRTVDVGVPQLAMHSIREMCGVDDINYAYSHFVEFFREFAVVDKSLEIDSFPPPDIQGTMQDQPCDHTHYPVIPAE